MRILVVDDEQANTLLIESILLDEGYASATSCTDSRDALAVHPEFQPHVVLLDLSMPVMDGHEVMRRTADSEPERCVPVLLLPGQQDRKTRLRALPAGARDFPTRPSDVTEVTLRIRNRLEVRILYDQLHDSHREFAAASRQLATCSADLEQFAWVASHDPQEPLRTVARFVPVLERRAADLIDERGRQYLERAVSGLKRVEALIHTLLVEQVVAVLSFTLDDSGGMVSCNGLPTVTALETQTRQVFQNLTGNGIKRRGLDAPRVDVSTDQKDGEWVFCARDNGIGLGREVDDRTSVIVQRLHGRGQYPATASASPCASGWSNATAGECGWTRSRPRDRRSTSHCQPREQNSWQPSASCSWKTTRTTGISPPWRSERATWRPSW
ncbi:response regulator [Candidatus Poribacteria bacterium]|nr:response regulator [Candidatus Poribacteria bacterium]MBT7100798.1 response regulator [Candidatus Poribacteria bacterium]